MWYKRLVLISESTQDDIKEALASDKTLGEGFCILAQEQCSGRGRHGRAWQSHKGDLAVSFCLEPQRNLQEWGSLSLVVGVALAQAIDIYAHPELKWPNDILLAGMKCAGILCEIENATVLVGIGVNCVSRNDDFSSLDNAVSANELFDLFLEKFEPLYQRWQLGGFSAVKPDWLGYAFETGRAISVKQGNLVKQGFFAGVQDDGSLLLEDANKFIRVITAGELLT